MKSCQDLESRLSIIPRWLFISCHFPPPPKWLMLGKTKPPPTPYWLGGGGSFGGIIWLQNLSASRRFLSSHLLPRESVASLWFSLNLHQQQISPLSSSREKADVVSSSWAISLPIQVFLWLPKVAYQLSLECPWPLLTQSSLPNWPPREPSYLSLPQLSWLSLAFLGCCSCSPASLPDYHKNHLIQVGLSLVVPLSCLWPLLTQSSLPPSGHHENHLI